MGEDTGRRVSMQLATMARLKRNSLYNEGESPSGGHVTAAPALQGQPQNHLHHCEHSLCGQVCTVSPAAQLSGQSGGSPGRTVSGQRGRGKAAELGTVGWPEGDRSGGESLPWACVSEEGFLRQGVSRSVGASHVKPRGKHIPVRRNSRCKGPKVGTAGCSRNKKDGGCDSE